MMPNTVRLHRLLATKPEKVYRAFIEADALAKWLPPNGFACTVHQLEAKVGSTPQMSFRNFTTGNSHSFGGKYVELVPMNACATLKNSRTQTCRVASGDGDTEESTRRHRAKHRPGSPAGCYAFGGVLPRLARIAAKLGEARRA
jgi:hypothetical protein